MTGGSNQAMPMNLRPSLVLPLLCCSLANAQSWSEAGDAGQSRAAAQSVTGVGPLTTITGALGGDVDMFLIQVDAPGTFTAGCAAGFDSVLWLFDENGLAVVGNDDTQVSNAAVLPTGVVRTPGRYYLAVGGFGLVPRSAAGELWSGGALWASGVPDGQGRFEPHAGWVGIGHSGSYTLTLTGARMLERRVVLPGSHHLSEHAQQLGSVGTTTWFTTTGSRFQLLYEGSHFVTAGVSGVVTIDRLLFRTEDGETFPANASWANAVVRVARTPVVASAMSTTFANNLAAPAVVAGPATTTVRLHPARGGTPNDFNIVIDLAAAGATIAYDPAGPLPNLLVDVTLLPSPAVNPSVPLAAVQDTTGSTASLAGAGVVGTSNTATTGTAANPLVMAVEFTGGSGGRERVVPARNEAYGAACGGAASSFYQAFVNGDRFDLQSLTLTPDSSTSPSRYTVSGVSVPFDGTKVAAAPLSTDDDAVVPVALGFVFPFPGGATSNVQVSTNGFLWLNGATTTQDFTPTVGEFLGSSAASPARLAPFWHDFHCGRNVGTFLSSGLHAVTDTSGGIGNRVCYITWKDVGEFNTVAAGGISAASMQVALFENGTVQFRYGAMPRFASSASLSPETFAGIVGFTRGRIGGVASVDPISRDLSLEVPFATAVEGSLGNLGLTSVGLPLAGGATVGARLFPGQSVTWDVRNVPPSTILGVQLIDIAANQPGLQLPTITASGCRLSTSSNAILWEVDLLPPSSVVGTHAFSVPPGYEGFELYAQYVVLNGLFGGPDLITQASNAIRHVVGAQ